MIEKKFGVDFHSDGGALTLSVSDVANSDEQGGTHTKTHTDGWTITGEVHEDYYTWVNDFEATHPVYGQVKGNFEASVFADTEEGFQHFMEHHAPNVWDYMDI